MNIFIKTNAGWTFKHIWISLAVLFVGVLMLPTTKERAMVKNIPWITNSKACTPVSKDAAELYRLGIGATKAGLKQIIEVEK